MGWQNNAGQASMRPVSGFVRENYHTGDGGFQRQADFVRDQVAVLFQDALVLPYTVAENVSLKPLEETDQNPGLGSSGTGGTFGADKAGAKRNFDPDDKGSIRGWNFLSGGEAQKLLMARMLYHKSAQIWILTSRQQRWMQLVRVKFMKNSGNLKKRKPVSIFPQACEHTIYGSYHSAKKTGRENTGKREPIKN